MSYFSIIVPVYNAEKFLNRSLESILRQTFSDFEVIVVDDGSKDNSLSIIEEYTDSRIHLIHQENQGVSAARNHGLAKAQGEWITFLDADDEWNPNFLQRFYETIAQKDNLDFCCCACKVFGSSQEETVDGLTDGGVSYFEDPYLWMSEHGQLPLWTGSLAIRADLFKQTGTFNTLKVGEDSHLWSRVMICSKSAAYIHAPLMIYYACVGGAQSYTENLKQGVFISHYPGLLLGIEEWRAENKIPPERLQSVQRFVQSQLPFLIRARGRHRAWSMARTILRRHLSFWRHPILYVHCLIAFSIGWIKSMKGPRIMVKRFLSLLGKRGFSPE